MKIILPVAGRGSRFYPESAYLPKCLIPIQGKLMIEWALASIWHQPEDVMVIYHADQNPLISCALRGLLPLATLIEQTSELQGAAHTVFQASNDWKLEKDVVVVDCDINAVSRYNCTNWNTFTGDGSVLSFRSYDPSKSYILDKNGFVHRIIEKNVVSSRAVGGIYHFRSGIELYKAIDKQITKHRTVKGEYYLSETVNIYLKKNPQFRFFEAERFYDNGTSDDVRRFEQFSYDFTT